MRITTIARLSMTAAIITAAALLAGCELNDNASDEVSGSSLEITPEYMEVTATANQQIIFQASGGTAPYGWSLSDTNGTYGTINANEDIAIYMMTAQKGSVFLTVADGAGAEATATIIQQ